MAAILVFADVALAQDRPAPAVGPSASRARFDRQAKHHQSAGLANGQNASNGAHGRPASGGRYNPYERNTKWWNVQPDGRPAKGDRSGRDPSPKGSVLVGTQVRDQRPRNYDGRGLARPRRYGAGPSHNVIQLSLSGRIIRGSRVGLGATFGGLRVGFVSYANFNPFGYAFAYPYYAYDPYVRGALVVASPWYGYSFMPPYVDRSRVVIMNQYPNWNWDGWVSLDPGDPRIAPNVRAALADLQDAFEAESGRIADRLVPEDGDVAILNGGRYDYSLRPDDFQMMFIDGVERSRTVRYELLDVRIRGNEIRVRARHTYLDSWGQRRSEIHRIGLREWYGGDYVIREFGME
ncbi:hypothetical protein EON82_09845 [bacterium]|nr:MAG: hypothetical protein EON82_09845 [bacterium]